MSTRSAPFNPSGFNLDADSKQSAKTQHRALFSVLLDDIKQFRDSRFPPAFLQQIYDMPIYHGNADTVAAYREDWEPLISEAKRFYPSAYMPPDNLPLPASLEIPQFIYHVEKVNLTKTKAKESKSFGSIGALTATCGEFSDSDIERLNDVVSSQSGVDFKLVAHREFIDLRAYVFCIDAKGEKLPPQRIRFYRTGLILQTTANFHVIDSRNAPRKRRNDAYRNPIADNGIWRVFLKNL
ncbi:MAG: hypothetical protein VYA60_04350 [Pseudomonadota bacterium]|nr:hypothetical protein [Pseudomonadota bacterium]